MSGKWIEWNGEYGLGPAESYVEVVVRMREGFEHDPATVGFWAGDGTEAQSNWLKSAKPYDIVAYRFCDVGAE